MITQTFNHLIDHTNLKPEAKLEDLIVLAKEAEAYRFNSVCIRPEFIKQISPLYKCSAVINFPKEKAIFESPKGTAEEQEKNLLEFCDHFFVKHKLDEMLSEVEQSLLDGALELDPVINVKHLVNEKPIKSNHIYEELTAIIDECLNLERELSTLHQSEKVNVFLKPIFSCELLNDAQLKYSIEILAAVSQYYKNKPEYENSNIRIDIAYKNSTGFIETGKDEAAANAELIQKIKNLLDLYDKKSTIQIKAAGGIQSYEDALKLINLGKERLSHLGTSSGIKICETL
ncbi:MAG: hypothetical protein HRT47_05360 [Candidatus Caenarcaniphilales bacterium]|nr:hypothetical protein [Candidatus Caenarcaniphilales bacterium]